MSTGAVLDRCELLAAAMTSRILTLAGRVVLTDKEGDGGHRGEDLFHGVALASEARFPDDIARGLRDTALRRDHPSPPFSQFSAEHRA